MDDEDFDPFAGYSDPAEHEREPEEPDRLFFSNIHESYGADAGDDGQTVWDGTTSVGPCSKIFRTHKPNDPFSELDDEDEHLVVTVNEELEGYDHEQLATEICAFLNAPSDKQLAFVGKAMRAAQNKYFKGGRKADDLAAAKALEYQFDSLLVVFEPKKPEPQGSLFSDAN